MSFVKMVSFPLALPGRFADSAAVCGQGWGAG